MSELRPILLAEDNYQGKPVRFPEFADAVKHIGVMWAILNELPPDEGASAE
jgi:hypothetical protein